MKKTQVYHLLRSMCFWNKKGLMILKG